MIRVRFASGVSIPAITTSARSRARSTSADAAVQGPAAVAVRRRGRRQWEDPADSAADVERKPAPQLALLARDAVDVVVRQTPRARNRVLNSVDRSPQISIKSPM